MTAIQTQDFGFDENRTGKIIRLAALALLVFFIWASFAWIDEIVRAEGEVISSSRPQIIQNLEGGILAELRVSEGDIVEQGDELGRLQDQRFAAVVADLKSQVDALEIKRLRLRAELEGHTEFSVPDTLAQANPQIVASERALLIARVNEQNSQIEGARGVLDQVARELALMQGLFKRKLIAEIELTRIKRAHAEARKAFDIAVNAARLDVSKQHSETLNTLASLNQNLKGSQDQLARTALVSPMRGIVDNISVTTIGGVVRSGEEILRISPLDDHLFVEARIAPKNIASLRPGQEATVKLSAYDYTIYGTLKARVEVISADTFKDEASRDPNAKPHYKVRLRMNLAELSGRQKPIEIRPGMLAQVELQVGEKTVLQYLLKPLYKSQEAFREP